MKILLIKNRYTKKLKLQKYLDWFKTKTPLSFTTEELSTDFDVLTMPVGNATYHGVVCDTNDLANKLCTVIPEGKYDVVVFIYGNELAGIRTNITHSTPLYYGTDIIQLCVVNDNGQVLNHELFHTFFYRLARQGIKLDDPMDYVVIDGVGHPYYNNTDFFAPISNRTIAFDRLKPYWSKVSIMAPQSPTSPVQGTVMITRQKGAKETLGTLKINGTNFTCRTLELPDVNNMPNISCIPKGTYQCTYTFSPRFLKYTYEIQNVPNRSGIRIHISNYYYELKGCIALGSDCADINADGELDVINSKVTVTAFENFLQKKPFTLTIK